MPPVHTFWEKLLDHRMVLAWILVFVSLMVLLRRVLPDSERPRLRLPSILFGLYLVHLPVRWLVGGLGYDAIAEGVGVAANILLAFGIIAVIGLLVFNVIGKSFSKVRILRDITSTAAAVVVLFYLLSRANVNVLSIVTTSAILTGVIGLAFQDTLGNILAGVALQLESTMSIGDWVKIDQITGQVAEIRWRSTAIVTRNDDTVIIPNSVLAKTTITNLSRPVPWHRQWVYFGVNYRHPPNLVERIVTEALQNIPNVKASDPGPDCILFALEQDHMQFAVRYRLLDLRRDDPTDAEVRKRIWYALRRSEIDVAYPARRVFVAEAKEHEQGKRDKARVRRLESLRHVDLFAPLEDSHLEHLCDRLDVDVFCAGEEILKQGQPGDSLYIIGHGQVSVRITVDGLVRELAVLSDGQFFGEMSLMTGEARRATVVAKTDVECYVIDRRLFQEIIGKRTNLVNELTTILTKRQMALQGEVAHLGAEASAKASEVHHADLVARISRFFGLGT